MVTVQSQVEVCVMSSQRKSLASTLDTQETWTQRSGQSGSVLNGLVKPPSVPTGGSDFSKVRRGAWPCFLILVCFACRVSLMTRSLYRDESWVADSVLSPSLGGMFHFEKWLQTTPPLFLLLVRGVVSIFGNSEIALRAVPWFAGLLSVVFVARTLARLFPAALAILGTSLFLSNYWAVKYSQQVKQYSTDVLISSLFLFLVTEFLSNREKRPIIYWALVFAGLGVFLSFTAVFWFPVGLLVVALANGDSAHSNLPELAAEFMNRLKVCLTMLFVYAGSFGLVYIFFVRPNRSGSLVQFWIDQFIGSGGLIPSLLRFFQSVCDLMLPQQFLWSRFFSYACGLFLLMGLLRALAAQREGDKRAVNILAVALPVFTALIASYFRQYPLLTKPRMIVWLLPICTLLLVYALEPLWARLTARAGVRTSALITGSLTIIICMVAVALSVFVVEKSRENAVDDFRSSVLYLSRNAGPHDPVFVYALGVEELDYYSQRADWHPDRIFAGNTNLGCCLPGSPAIVGDDSRKAGLVQDVHSFVQDANGEHVWFLLQSGIHQQLIVEHARSEASAALCRDGTTSTFESTLLMSFDCGSPDEGLQGKVTVSSVPRCIISRRVKRQ